MKTPIHITPSRASQSAIRAVEKLGGTVICKHYNDLALRDCVHGRTDRTEAAPTNKRDICTCRIMLAHNRSSPVCNSMVHIVEEPWIPLPYGCQDLAHSPRPLEAPVRAAHQVQGAEDCAAKAIIDIRPRTARVTTIVLCPYMINHVAILSGEILRLRDR